MNYYRACIIVPLLVLMAHVVRAAGPLDPGSAGVLFEKQLNGSTDYPLSLFKTTNVIHNVAAVNDPKFFTARVISRLDGTGLTISDKSAVLNEICASELIQRIHVALPFEQLPGAIGFFRYHDAVVAIHDVGLAGVSLEDALSRLANVTDPAIKIIFANKYANALVNLLDKAHRANVLWNVDSLSKFYVRPDGSLTGIDFSMAKQDAQPLFMNSAPKMKERKEFLAQIILPLYEALFPPASKPGGVPGVVMTAYNRFINNLNGLNGGDSWRTTNTNFGDVNFRNLGQPLVAPMPYMPPVDPAIRSVVRADHESTQPVVGNVAYLGHNGFALDNRVLRLLPPAGRLVGIPVGAETSLCEGWTGD